MMMKQEPTLCRARALDAERLTEIALTAKAHWGYSQAFMDACREELTITPARIASERIMVATDGPEIAGFLSLVQAPGDGFAEVEDLFIAPDHMGRGLGQALMNEALAHARETHVSRIEVDADPNAVGFYEACGFRIFAEAPSASIPGRVLPRLALDLKR